jgi:hypothetical protein
MESLEDDIVNEGAWAAIVINNGATTSLAQARAGGDASYNGQSAISVVYAQARSETAVGSYLLPLMQQALGVATNMAGAESI